jgi:hypothetical protein
MHRGRFDDLIKDAEPSGIVEGLTFQLVECY